MVKEVIDKGKQVAVKTKETIEKVIHAIKFFVFNPIGQFLGIVCLCLSLAIFLFIAVKIVMNAIDIFFNDDYAGVSTTEDYEVIVGTMSSSGYDAYVSEEKWQDYSAFEYAVLMDVAEFIYYNQDYLVDALDESGHTVMKKDADGKDTGEAEMTSAVFPEGIVHTSYNQEGYIEGEERPGHERFKKKDWQAFAVEGQKGAEHSVTEKNDEDRKLLGGNRNVYTPRLIYEIADHEYEEEAFSLMPYITVVREDIELNYFLFDDAKNPYRKDSNHPELTIELQEWRKSTKDTYGDNLKDIKLTNPNTGKEMVSGDNALEPVRFSAELNQYNYFMPVSAYKKDILEEYHDNEMVMGVQQKFGDSNGSNGAGGNSDKKDGIEKKYIGADRYDFVKEGETDANGKEKRNYYGDDVYYIEQAKHIVYKIPLKILINRYLPKATLLTAWYMVKTDEKDGEEGGSTTTFDIDKLLTTIKEIYNYGCYRSNEDYDKVTDENGRIFTFKYNITGKIDENGKKQKGGAGGEIRIPDISDDGEGFDTDNVEAVQYDDYGRIIRDEEGKAIKGDKEIKYTAQEKTNRGTFIYFQQFGLETQRYEKYKVYLGPSGENLLDAKNKKGLDVLASGDEARPVAESPSIDYLTREKVNMIEALNLNLKDIHYYYRDLNNDQKMKILGIDEYGNFDDDGDPDVVGWTINGTKTIFSSNEEMKEELSKYINGEEDVENSETNDAEDENSETNDADDESSETFDLGAFLSSIQFIHGVGDFPLKFRTAMNYTDKTKDEVRYSGDEYEKIKSNFLYNTDLSLTARNTTGIKDGIWFPEVAKKWVPLAEQMVYSTEDTDWEGEHYWNDVDYIGGKKQVQISQKGRSGDDGEWIYNNLRINKFYIPAEIVNYYELMKEKYHEDELEVKKHPDEWYYKPNEDYSFYNQDYTNLDDNDDEYIEQDMDFQVNKLIAHWYDLLTGDDGKPVDKEEWEEGRNKLEEAYLDALMYDGAEEDRKLYLDTKKHYREEDSLTGANIIYEMDLTVVRDAKKEYVGGTMEDAKKHIFLEKGFDKLEYATEVEYLYSNSAELYVNKGDERNKTKNSDAIHNPDGEEVFNGEYRVNYYWMPLYTVKEKKLEMRQAIHHRRMPALFVEDVEMWSKRTNYYNIVTMNPISYRNMRYLIPDSINSLGIENLELKERAAYRTETFKEFFDKKSEEDPPAIKEADVLNMLIQWEKYGDESNEVAYAFMRELYKLIIEIRDSGKGLMEKSYSYLYIPYTISNFDDATTQLVFWTERLAATEGDDELTEAEQLQTRTKGYEPRWQNLEYDEYDECITSGKEGTSGKETFGVYAVFPYGSPYIRAYAVLEGYGSIQSQKAHDGELAGDNALDLVSRKKIEEIYRHQSGTPKYIYFYELNRRTTAYMRAGNRKVDAFLMAEEDLNKELKSHALYSPIVAIAPGVVTKVKYDSRSGFQVKIAHTLRNQAGGSASCNSFYCHFKRWPRVEVGDKVGAGTVLGYEGTTGRSTGYHLHFEALSSEARGGENGPQGYIEPIFNPFFYYDKMEKALEDEEMKKLALGSPYFSLDRTIMPQFQLNKDYFYIEGLKLKDGYEIKAEDAKEPTASYKHDEPYSDGTMDMVWGNNVPYTPLTKDLNHFWDINLLNSTTEYQKELGFVLGDDGHTPNKKEDGFPIGDFADGPDVSFEDDVTSNPEYFLKEDNGEYTKFIEERLDWKKWFAVQMAEYKSPRVVPYYNGPEDKDNNGQELSGEALRDLKFMQESLKKAGYYRKAKVEFEPNYGEFTDEFKEVVKEMQKDLEKKDYKSKKDGKLTLETVYLYNTMMQYTKKENQDEMAKRVSYNSAVDLSDEAAVLWSIADNESGFISLTEKDGSQHKELYYKLEKKDFNKDQGLMQVGPQTAIRRYEEDDVESGDAVLFIRQPMRNTNVGIELLKEYMILVYRDFSGDLIKCRNLLLYDAKGTRSDGKEIKVDQYWKDLIKTKDDSLMKLQEKNDKLEQKEPYPWCDPQDCDKLFVYALAYRAFVYEREVGNDVYWDYEENKWEDLYEKVIENAPEGNVQNFIEKYKEYMTDGGK